MPTQQDVDEKIGECYCCSFADITVKKYKRNALFMTGQSQYWYLCKICSTSFLSNVVDYNKESANQELARSMGYCTNLILKAIENKPRIQGPHVEPFTCPECGGHFFGSKDSAGGRLTRYCHDQNGVGCRWSGSTKECMTEDDINTEELIAFGFNLGVKSITEKK